MPGCRSSLRPRRMPNDPFKKGGEKMESIWILIGIAMFGLLLCSTHQWRRKHRERAIALKRLEIYSNLLK